MCVVGICVLWVYGLCICLCMCVVGCIEGVCSFGCVSDIAYEGVWVCCVCMDGVVFVCVCGCTGGVGV